jgi:hypothetical protein
MSSVRQHCHSEEPKSTKNLLLMVEPQLGRPGVKALNNIYAQHLLERGRPAGSHCTHMTAHT